MIQNIDPAMGRNHSFDIKVSYLCRRMNPRICSSRRMNPDRVLYHRLNDRLNLFLHCSLIRLPLPTTEMSSLILNNQSNTL
jgi:hypothetical protein